MLGYARSCGERKSGPLAVLATLALALGGGSALAVESASGVSRPATRIARFSLRGSHGYKVSVFATVEGAHSPIRVAVENRKGKAEYQVTGLVTPARIKGSFRSYGAISLRFHPSGGVFHTMVDGDEACPYGAKARAGTFTGTFRFQGENGYTRVLAHRTRGGVGAPTAPIDRQEEESFGCQDASNSLIASRGPFPEPIAKNESGFPELAAAAISPGKAIAFAASQSALEEDGKPIGKPEFCFFVALAEETRGRVAIARLALALGELTECPFDEAAGTATVAPEAPFKGSATLQRAADGTSAWIGSLSVPMLGSGIVPLTGPEFKAELLPPR